MLRLMAARNARHTLWRMLKAAASDFMDDKAMRLSAAMAYYAVFSIGPLLFLAIGIAGLVFGEDTVKHTIQAKLTSALGGQSTAIIDSMVSARKTGGSWLATIIGGAGLLLAASAVFGQLHDALNTIWEVKLKPGGGILRSVKSRFLFFGMVLVIGLLLLGSMVLTTLIHAATSQISSLIMVPTWVTQSLNLAVPFAVITLLFAGVFKFLPDVKIGWGDVWIGAGVTALLYAAGNFVLGWYLGRQSTVSAYGAGGAFILILLYIYYSAIILFFGAEFTQVYARYRGTVIVPNKNAVSIADPHTGRFAARVKAGVSNLAAAATAGAGAPANALSPKRTAMARAYKKSHPPAKSTAFIPPLEQIRARPFSFMGLALTAGLAAGLVLKLRTLRNGLKWYLATRRIL